MLAMALWTLFTAVLLAAAPSGATEPLRLRYVANAGVMLTLDGHKILIDAPIRDGIKPYATSTADERRRLEGATVPYDGVAAILVTHWHEDHFSAEAIAEHLRHNRRTVLVSSREIVGRVRAIAADLGADRFAGITPEPGHSAAVTVGSVKVHVLRARHNPTRRWPEEHVAFLVEGSQTVLHTGDAEVTPANFAVLRNLPRVDVAVMPYWHLLNSTRRNKTIVPIIRPARMVGMHLAPDDAAEAQREIAAGKLDATLCVTPGMELPFPAPR